MSTVEPLEGLTGLDGPIEPRAEFAETLLAACLAELAPARRGRTRGRALRIALAAAVVALVLAAVATATYLILHTSRSTGSSTKAQLTVIRPVGARISGPNPDLAQVSVVGLNGRLRTVWSCPNRTWCGTLTSIAWSPNGRYLAMSLGEIGGRSGYVGLHVVDLATGADRHLGVPAIPHIEREQPESVLRALVERSTKTLGCPLPHEVAWSPDSTQLVYVCGDDLLNGGQQTSIYVIRVDGTQRRLLRTGTRSAYWPAWSPDGRRIAFADQPDSASDVYMVRLDGTGRTVVARRATAPAWAPDGKTIAYSTACGVRFAAVDGGRAPTGCLRASAPARVAWAPDGRLAIGTRNGVELARVDANGPSSGSDAVNADPLGVYHAGRPAWAPETAIRRILRRRHLSGL